MVCACHFRNVLRQHALAVAENVGRERHVAELGPGLRELQRLRRHALARMDHQHGRAPAGHLVVVGHIGFELGVAVAVLDPLVLHLGLRRHRGQGENGGQNGRNGSYIAEPASSQSHDQVLTHSVVRPGVTAWRSQKSLTNTLKRIGFATSLSTARIEKWPRQSKYRAGFFGELERHAR